VTLQSATVSYPDIAVLRSELEAYQYTISAGGQLQYAAPEGDHDDCVISLALAVWAAQHPVWKADPHFYADEEEIISPV
jgi:hypothetical protein